MENQEQTPRAEEKDTLKERLLREQTLWNEGERAPKHAGGIPPGAIEGKVEEQPHVEADQLPGKPPRSSETQYQGA